MPPQADWPAFPTNGADINDGMALRDWFAATAPVDLAAALNCWGSDIDQLRLGSDAERAGFFGCWALMRYEYADAMLAQRTSAA